MAAPNRPATPTEDEQVTDRTDPVPTESFVAEAPSGPVPSLLFAQWGAAPLVLLGHGGNGGKDQPNMVRLAERMRDTIGVHVLAIDGPAHGERAPQTTGDERLRGTRRVLNDPSTSSQMAADWSAAVAVARQRVDVGEHDLGYIGFSMGTVFGIPAVAAIDKVKAAVFGIGGLFRQDSVGDIVRVAGLGEQAARIIEEEERPEIRNQSILEGAAAIRDCEVLMINTTRDESFAMDGVLEVFGAMSCAKRMMLWEAGHTGLPPEAYAAALGFLAHHLGTSRSHAVHDSESAASGAVW